MVIHRFGPFEVDEERFELRRDGKVVRVQRRVLDTIVYLVTSGGRLVTKDDLIKGPWQNASVTDAAFSQAIMLARRALSDPNEPRAFIATVRGKGFRFDGAARDSAGAAVRDATGAVVRDPAGAVARDPAGAAARDPAGAVARDSAEGAAREGSGERDGRADRHDAPGVWAPLTITYPGRLPGMSGPSQPGTSGGRRQPDEDTSPHHGDRTAARHRSPRSFRTPLPVHEALRTAGRMESVARRLGDRGQLLEAHLRRAQCFLELGQHSDFAREATAHDRLARETRHPMHLWYRAVMASTRSHQDARIASAEKLIRTHLRLGVATVGPAAEGTAAAHLLNLAFEMRGPARAKAFRQSLFLAQRCARREPGIFVWRSLSAVVWLQLGNPIRARALFQELAREVARLPDDRALVPSLVNVIDLLIAFRDWRRLGAVYERMLAYDGMRVCFDFSDWGSVSFHLGRASRELGEPAVSHRHFARAIEESDRAGAVCWKAWAQYACARALADTGRRADARRAIALLRKTAATARRFDMAALRQASASLGQPPSPASFLTTARPPSPSAKEAPKRARRPKR